MTTDDLNRILEGPIVRDPADDRAATLYAIRHNAADLLPALGLELEEEVPC